MKPIAYFNFSLDVDCPNCGENIDMTDNDDDGVVTRPLFSDNWKDLEDFEVYCEKCDHEFKIKKVEY